MRYSDPKCIQEIGHNCLQTNCEQLIMKLLKNQHPYKLISGKQVLDNLQARFEKKRDYEYLLGLHTIKDILEPIKKLMLPLQADTSKN
uniref:Uncharacterized protein n=1 Tax=Romanomermis culicivorax TaxID=13658 RepID=A0A915JH03_ROMCU